MVNISVWVSPLSVAQAAVRLRRTPAIRRTANAAPAGAAPVAGNLPRGPEAATEPLSAPPFEPPAHLPPKLNVLHRPAVSER